MYIFGPLRARKKASEGQFWPVGRILCMPGQNSGAVKKNGQMAHIRGESLKCDVNMKWQCPNNKIRCRLSFLCDNS